MHWNWYVMYDRKVCINIFVMAKRKIYRILLDFHTKKLDRTLHRTFKSLDFEMKLISKIDFYCTIRECWMNIISLNCIYDSHYDMMRFLKFIKCLRWKKNLYQNLESNVQANKCSIYNSCCQTVVGK